MISFTISGSLPLHLPHAKYSVGVHAVAIVFETTAGSTKFETLYDIQGIYMPHEYIHYIQFLLSTTTEESFVFLCIYIVMC